MVCEAMVRMVEKIEKPLRPHNGRPEGLQAYANPRSYTPPPVESKPMIPAPERAKKWTSTSTQVPTAVSIPGRGAESEVPGRPHGCIIQLADFPIPHASGCSRGFPRRIHPKQEFDLALDPRLLEVR